MDLTVSAIFDAGVFRPLGPVGLADGTHVRLQVVDSSDAATVHETSKKAWLDYLDRMESLPDNSPQDGLSNRDHDRIIYGS